MSVVDLFEAPGWQMVAGERAAFEGMLSYTKPSLAIEIGTAGGGSLLRVAAHSRAVHSFDLVKPPDDIGRLSNVTFHTGDSHRLLGPFLRELADRSLNIDFALVDGDHTANGVRLDVEELLNSQAVNATVILLHDTANPDVRAGLEAVDYSSRDKVLAVDLDFVPGYLVKGKDFHHEAWGGLGLVVVDGSRRAGHRMHLVSNFAYPAAAILAEHQKRLT